MKKAIAIPITIHFSIRYLLRTNFLRNLVNYFDVVVLLNWEDENLKKEFNKLNIKVIELPVYQGSNKNFKYTSKINNIKFTRKIKSVSTRIDKNRNLFLAKTRPTKFKAKIISNLILGLSFIWPFSLLEKLELFLIRNDDSFLESLRILDFNKIDFLLTLTPFLTEEFALLKAAEHKKIPIHYSVLSFDNLTTRGYFPTRFSKFYVWNTINKNEVFRIFGNESFVDVVGPVQFDFYWNEKYCLSERNWKQNHSIPNNRPLILFGGGFYTIVPNETEFLKVIDQKITNGQIINNPLIIFRRHPLDPLERWEKILEHCQNVIILNPWDTNSAMKASGNITENDIVELCSVLRFTDIHINTSSTLTIDGAIFDKPQIGPAFCSYDNNLSGLIHALYFREHYLPITNSGGLQIAHSEEELVNLINEALLFPGKYSKERKKLVGLFCEDEFGQSSERLLNSILKSIDS